MILALVTSTLATLGPQSSGSPDLAISARSGTRPQTSEPLRNRRVVFDGWITSTSAPDLIRRLRYGDELVITSRGGEVMAALQLAEHVANKAVSVRVDRYCASACAQYVFASGRRRILPKGSLLLFHNYFSAWLPLIAGNFGQNFGNIALEGTRRERELYRKLGISDSLVECIHNVLDIDYNSFDPTRMWMSSKFSMVQLSPALLERHGMAVVVTSGTPSTEPGLSEDDLKRVAYKDHCG